MCREEIEAMWKSQKKTSQDVNREVLAQLASIRIDKGNRGIFRHELFFIAGFESEVTAAFLSTYHLYPLVFPIIPSCCLLFPLIAPPTALRHIFTTLVSGDDGDRKDNLLRWRASHSSAHGGRHQNISRSRRP